MGLNAFMDDTTHHLGNDCDYLLSTLIPDAQSNATYGKVSYRQAEVCSIPASVVVPLSSGASTTALGIPHYLTNPTSLPTTSLPQMHMATNKFFIAILNTTPFTFLAFI